MIYANGHSHIFYWKLACKLLVDKM